MYMYMYDIMYTYWIEFRAYYNNEKPGTSLRVMAARKLD